MPFLDELECCHMRINLWNRKKPAQISTNQLTILTESWFQIQRETKAVIWILMPSCIYTIKLWQFKGQLNPINIDIKEYACDCLHVCLCVYIIHMYIHILYTIYIHSVIFIHICSTFQRKKKWAWEWMIVEYIYF